METALVALETARRLAQKAGPYLLVEMALPGGTLIALALWLYRNHSRR